MWFQYQIIGKILSHILLVLFQLLNPSWWNTNLYNLKHFCPSRTKRTVSRATPKRESLYNAPTHIVGYHTLNRTSQQWYCHRQEMGDLYGTTFDLLVRVWTTKSIVTGISPMIRESPKSTLFLQLSEPQIWYSLVVKPYIWFFFKNICIIVLKID